MRIVFMGSPSFAVTVLEALCDSTHEVCAVYTAPDAASGRGKALKPTPVADFASVHSLSLRKPASLLGSEELLFLESLSPDVVVTASYRMLLPSPVLELPRYCCLNVHPSLLPRWRGAAPLQRAVLSGDERTGVCIMRMSEGFDTGDIGATYECQCLGMSAEELSEVLSRQGSGLLLDVLSQIERGAAKWKPQGASGACYAEKIDKRELRLSPGDSAEDNLRRVLAQGASAPAKAKIFGVSCTVFDAACVETSPGKGSVAVEDGMLTLGCGDGRAIRVGTLKPDGSKAMSADAWLRGLRGARPGWEKL